MTNGFDIAMVTAAMFKRIGWRASTIGGPTLSADNTASTSGRYFNDAHALLTIPNVKAVIDNPNIVDADFNNELSALQKAVIMAALSAVFSGPEYHEQCLLYDRQEAITAFIGNEGLFAGWEITVAKDATKAIVIESAVLSFNADVNLTLYLFKEGKKSPVWSQQVAAEANEATVVDLDSCFLRYIGNSSNTALSTKGDRFFFGYFQQDLGTAEAIREEVCFNTTCFFSCQPFSAKQIDGETDFQRSAYYQPAIPYGVNLQVSTVSDWTPLIIRSASVFDDLIMLTMAYTVIEKLVYTTRSNSTERLLKDAVTMAAAMQELTGVAPVSDGPKAITGLNKRIEKEAENVYKTFFKKPKSTTINLAGCS